MSEDTVAKIFAEIIGTQTPAEPAARPKPAVKLPAPITQYDEAAQSLRSPADHFFSALALLEAPKPWPGSTSRSAFLHTL